VIADIGAGLRGSSAPARLVTNADLLLRDVDGWSALRPDVVLHLGGESVSKPLARYLRENGADRVVRVAPDPRRRDPDHLTSDRIVSDVTAFEASTRVLGVGRADDAWLAAWAGRNRAVADAVETALANSALDEPRVARDVGAALPREWGLFLGSSMPIRDADIFAARAPDNVAANRGASGIDGTIATACGYAAGLGRPVCLLCGDLAALHDLNALLLLRAADPPVAAVVVNNDGGGIFHFLPVAGETDRFEAWFGTPHGVSLAPLAAQFGVPVSTPEKPAALAAALEEAVGAPAPRLIEIRTERAANRARHAELEAIALAAK
jgi:2-succinyl-5-enolpyruvyl-6-hydroxy-3-cyclohexene-1-carboxylate synthase